MNQAHSGLFLVFGKIISGRTANPQMFDGGQ